ncbi:hypothetical protein GGR51DRAFT_535311 [Nemania sp. FL0031]|nr:hypothetical protein GGR51DRAFT_535311 [Nemania sp. FL0031]
MALTDGLLGPVLGGVLSFLGAIIAAIIAFSLTRLNRARPADEERPYIYNHELGLISNYDGSHEADRIQHSQHRLIEYCRSLEVNVARARRP